MNQAAENSKVGAWRIVLVEDHPLIRDAYRIVIDAQSDMQVSGCFSDSRDLTEMLRTAQIDVIMMDYRLSDDDADGVSLIQRLRSCFPATRLLVCSASSDSATVAAAILAGADGFLSKRATLQECIGALRRVAGGQRYLGTPPSGRTPGDWSISFGRWAENRGLEAAISGIGMPDDLTIKEFDVLRCSLQGLSATQIAEKFRRSVKTVSGHRVAAFRKQGLSNDAELCRLHPRARDG